MSNEIITLKIKANTAYEIQSDPEKDMGEGIIFSVEQPSFADISDVELDYILSEIGSEKVQEWIDNQKDE